MDKDNFALIMTGGVGTRFWPASTVEFPKQFHDMMDSGQSLLQNTVNRFLSFIPNENVFILTNERYESMVLKQLEGIIQKCQIISEPVKRNTAPCLTYAAMKILKINPDARLIVSPSDHWIVDTENFKKDMLLAVNCADLSSLITLGIPPNEPATGYGYIAVKPDDLKNKITKVLQFTEKPNLEMAISFLKSGNYFWNSGIFVWHVKAFLNGMKLHCKELFSLFNVGKGVYNTSDERKFIERNYSKAEDISIDYALLEKAESVLAIRAAFDWNDLGSWKSLYYQLPKSENENVVIAAKAYFENANGNLVKAPKGKKVVVSGLTDYLIVDTGDILMIHPKNQDQEIKSLEQKASKSWER